MKGYPSTLLFSSALPPTLGGQKMCRMTLPHGLCRRAMLISFLLLALIPSSSSFSPPPRNPNSGRVGFFGEGDDDFSRCHGLDPQSTLLSAMILSPSETKYQEEIFSGEGNGCRNKELSSSSSPPRHMSTTAEGDYKDSPVAVLEIRGGGIGQTISQKRNDMIDGVKDAIDDTLSYWSGALDFLDTRFLPGGRTRQRQKAGKRAAAESERNEKRSNKQKKVKLTRQEKKAMKQMDAVTVKSVITKPKSNILPPSVLVDAGRKSGLVGGKFGSDTVEQCSRVIKEWYDSAGYVLNSVKGATLDVDNAVAELEIEEFKTSASPVEVVGVKEVAIDDRTGETMSIPAYRRKLAAEGKVVGAAQIFNTTLIETKAKTKGSAIAGALRLRPGEPFQWDRSKWAKVESAESGLFSRVWNVAPTKAPDGTVQLRVVATEAPSRNLEYGVTKSLYNDLWEAELDFSNSNVFGGGERLGLMVRQGRKEPQPSFNIKFTGAALSTAKGSYDIEAFNEYIGVTGHEGGASSRRGVTVRLPELIPRTTTSTSIEKTLARTRTGEQDRLAHINFDTGPFRHRIPGTRNGGSSIQGTANIGTKLDMDKLKGSKKAISKGISPYSSFSAMTRQIIPLTTPSKATARPITLALQHRATASTSQLPEHEALAVGFAARVRGYSPRMNGPLSSSIVGTGEVRIPVTIPYNSLLEDGSVVLFGDWMAASRWTIRDIKNKVKSKTVGSAAAPLLTKPIRKSSFGIGIRSTLQGIPVKADFVITDDGKIGTHVALGRDFGL